MFQKEVHDLKVEQFAPINLQTSTERNYRSLNILWTFEGFQGTHSYGVRTFIESVCLSFSDPFLIGCEKSHHKLLGFWLS